MSREPHFEDQTEYSPSKIPEHRLLANFLARNIADVLSDTKEPNRACHRRDAIAWFLAGDFELFSFLWTCEHLDLDSATILNIIQKQITVENTSIISITKTVRDMRRYRRKDMYAG